MGYEMPFRPPSRINFNFLAKCNMTCPYCYLPFDGTETNLGLWKKIIDRVIKWESQSITFGGGDPFIYPEFQELLLYTRQNHKSVKLIQVDTNGIRLRNEHYQLLRENSDLVGLPLDGSNSQIHQLMRQHSNHFKIVIHLLDELTKNGIAIKVNTVVSKINIDDLERISELLRNFPIKSWSLYEFWALGPSGVEHADKYTLPHDIFMEKASYIQKIHYSSHVDIDTVDKRHHVYFFVSQTGRAYTIDHKNPYMYIELGSIFDNAVLQKWDAHADQRKMLARIESRITQLEEKSS